MNEEKIKILSSVDLFENLSINELTAIVVKLKDVNFRQKQIVIFQGDEDNSLFIIKKGLVKVYKTTEDGEEIGFSVLSEGEVFGEMALIDHLPRSATVEAIKESSFYVLSGHDFQSILQQYPSVAVKLLSSLTKKIRRLDDKLEDVVSKDLSTRTEHVLRTLSGYFTNQEIQISQEDLAIIIGASRPRVTLALKELEGKGKISLSHRKIKVL